jgi:hypothetical protein
VLQSSLENAVRSVVVAQNELSPISKLPPETLITISEFIAEPGTRLSMFEIVKLTHTCQYWRSTLISCPRVWSSIFVKTDHKDFVAACLERSRELPLTVYLDLKHSDYDDCTCIRNEWSSGMQVDEKNPCLYHATINPLLNADHLQRICELDVLLTMLDVLGEGPDQDFNDALDGFEIFTSPLPSLESLTIGVDHELDVDSHLNFQGDLFCWGMFPPTKLRHLNLHGCYGGPIWAVHNLTSFELAGNEENFGPMELNQFSFLPTLFGSSSLVSLTLTHCGFPDPGQSLRVPPVKLLNLKTLRLTCIYGLSGFSGLIEVPAFKTLSSLHVSIQKHLSRFHNPANLEERYQVCAATLASSYSVMPTIRTT